MRVLLPLLVLTQATVATSCARAFIYDCGHRTGTDPVRVDVRRR